MNLSMKQKQTQKHQEQTCQGGGGLVEAWIGTWDWQMKTYMDQKIDSKGRMKRSE